MNDLKNDQISANSNRKDPKKPSRFPRCVDATYEDYFLIHLLSTIIGPGPGKVFNPNDYKPINE
jgi:hypothetical protein